MSTKNVIPMTSTNAVENNFAGNKEIIDNSEIPGDVVPLCCVVCGYLTLTLASIAWMIASSIALAQSSIAEFQEDCPGSNIWVSLIVLTIAVGLGMLDNWCGKRDKDNKRQPNILIMGFGLGSQIFSSVEVFNGCAMNNLNETLVYQLQFWMLIVAYSLYGLLILGLMVMCCICCREEAAYKTKNDEIENMENVFANLDATLKNLKKGETVIGDDNV